MRQRVKEVFNSPVVFYPVLLAAFPILFLYAHNISETSASQLWLPLGVSVGATLVLWAVLSLALRSLAKAGLAVAVLLVFFFSYGRLYDVLEHWALFVPRHAYLFTGMFFIWGYCIYFISRARRDFRVTTRLLNVVAVVLIVINLFNIGSYHIRLARVSDEQPEQTTGQLSADASELSNLPDIYFIILDEYAHPDTMLEWYDYDNSDFIHGLEERGFFVASQSRTRTPHSHQAIAQILNMKYLTPGYYWDETSAEFEMVDTEGSVRPVSTGEAYRMVACNEVSDLLRAQGYQYIAFGNWYTTDRYGPYLSDCADVYLNYYEESATHWVSEFQQTLLSTTMLRPFYQYVLGSQYEIAHRRMTLNTVEHLKVLPEKEGPKFVFAHFMCPHEALVFGPDGQAISPGNWYNYRDREYYRGQYTFISAQIEEVVDVLLKESENPPIIIIQSDHGLRPHHAGITIGSDEWRKILNVMYLPGVDYDELCDSISPVNTFRLIFNQYFGADYPLLEDD